MTAQAGRKDGAKGRKMTDRDTETARRTTLSKCVRRREHKYHFPSTFHTDGVSIVVPWERLYDRITKECSHIKPPEATGTPWSKFNVRQQEEEDTPATTGFAAPTDPILGAHGVPRGLFHLSAVPEGDQSLVTAVDPGNTNTLCTPVGHTLT